MIDKSRRDFMASCAQLLVAVMGTAFLGKEILSPQAAIADDVQHPLSFEKSDKKSGANILIAYASNSGSTAEIAKEMGDVLRQDGNTVVTQWAHDVDDIDSYDAVIIGSPIIREKWMSEARDFLQNHQEQLMQKQVACFYTCLALHEKSAKGEQDALKYTQHVKNLVPTIDPIDVKGFAGVLDFSKIGFFTRMLLKTVLLGKDVKEGDYRDWDEIKGWTKSINSKLNVSTS